MDFQTHPHSMEGSSRSSPQDAFSVDIEAKAAADTHLMNDTVENFTWNGVTVTVSDNKTGQPKAILDNIDGIVEAGMVFIPYIGLFTNSIPGEMCALMGPSGCGKTTLLNVLARRDAAASSKVEGVPLINGNNPTLHNFRRLTSYVEQEDALIGSLTVKETMHFAARLAHKK